MSILTTLGGYSYDTDGVRHQLPVIINASGLTVNATIENVVGAGRGVVVLRNKNALEVGPEKLELYAENGKFLLMLGVNEEDGDYSVRTLTNECVSEDFMVIMGEKFPAKAITRDIGCVFKAFNEFALSGDVTFMR
jgi:hypothetical protein